MSAPGRYRTLLGAGKVHLAEHLPRFGGAYIVLYCTGRAMQGLARTEAPVECKACLAKARREGVEV